MEEGEGIQVTFLDQTGAKSVKAKIAPTVPVKKVIPNIITKMMLPTTSPDGQPMSYSLDWKEGQKRLQENQTLPEAGVKNGDHLIVYPEIVAGCGLVLHKRSTLVREAHCDLAKAVCDIAEKHKLTYTELLGIILEEAMTWNRQALRHERHPDDPGKKADEE